MMKNTVNENAAGLRRICKSAVFSFVVLYIIVLRLFNIFGAVGLFRSDMLLIFNMVWA